MLEAGGRYEIDGDCVDLSVVAHEHRCVGRTGFGLDDEPGHLCFIDHYDFRVETAG